MNHKSGLEKFITSNSNCNSTLNIDEEDGVALVQLFTNDLYSANVQLKIAKSISRMKNYRLIVVPSIRIRNSMSKLIKSYYPLTLVDIKIKSIIFMNIRYIFQVLTKIKTGRQLLELKCDHIHIGSYIYDHILRKHGLHTIKYITFDMIPTIVQGLIYFKTYQRLFKKYSPQISISLDTVYIEGIFFELSKNSNIPCITGIDTNGIALHHYTNKKSFKYHCRTPDIEVVNIVLADKTIYDDKIKSYMRKRYSGLDKQHDAKRAYSVDKKLLTKNQLISKYRLNGNKKIVLILPHIFQDAPHAFPGNLFDDYYHWFKYTIDTLISIGDYNIIVKEHPSADLYGEQNILNELFSPTYDAKISIISKDISAATLMTSCDVLITCGGTAGLEYAVAGVKVILASRPPYSDYGFVNTANTIDDYLNLLHNINGIKQPTKEMMNMASVILYIIHQKQKINKKYFGLGEMHHGLGVDFNIDSYFESIADTTTIIDGYSNMAIALENMFDRNLKNLSDDLLNN